MWDTRGISLYCITTTQFWPFLVGCQGLPGAPGTFSLFLISIQCSAQKAEPMWFQLQPPSIPYHTQSLSIFIQGHGGMSAPINQQPQPRGDQREDQNPLLSLLPPSRFSTLLPRSEPIPSLVQSHSFLARRRDLWRGWLERHLLTRRRHRFVRRHVPELLRTGPQILNRWEDRRSADRSLLCGRPTALDRRCGVDVPTSDSDSHANSWGGRDTLW
jgi:hypothetical protein